MSRVQVLALIAFSAALAACASPRGEPAAAFTPPAVIEADARISFAAMGGVRNWRAFPDGSLLIESQRGQFYRATFFGSCPELPFASAIGFLNDSVGSLDRFSGVVVRDRVCRFRSLDEVAAPTAPPGDAPQPGA